MSYPRRKGYPKDYYKPYSTNLFKKTKDKKQDRKIKKIENILGAVETKHKNGFDALGGGIPTASTNAMRIVLLSNIAQGDTDTARQGDKVQITGLDFTYYAWPEGGHVNWLGSRVIIFQDKSYQGTPATDANLLVATDYTNGNILNLITPLNPDRFPMKGDTSIQKAMKPYRLIADFTLFNNTAAGTNTVSSPKVKRIRKRFKKGLSVQYSGAADRFGSIFVAIFPGSQTTANQNPYITYDSMLYFRDM